MKTWLITGASRGFGLRIARLALEQGDSVVATARRADAATEALGERDHLLALSLDVTDEAQAKAATAAAVGRFGSIDVLVNNAGFGLLAVTRAVLPTMRAQRSGRILNMSSIGGYRGAAGFGVYRACDSRRTRLFPHRLPRCELAIDPQRKHPRL